VVLSSWQNSPGYEEWLEGSAWSQTFGLYLFPQLMVLTCDVFQDNMGMVIVDVC
jgi:hypothetical protein